MDRLLEIGEIGLLRNIPEELDFLTSQVSSLTRENSRLKSYLQIGGLAIAGYILYRLIKNAQENEENDEHTHS